MSRILFLSGIPGCSTSPMGKSAGPNCGLLQPPSDAGENGFHGALLKVYPREADIGASYSGCQTVWLQEGKDWRIVMTGRFENGQVARMRFPSKPGDAVEQCLKRAGVLVEGDRNVCSALDAFPYESVPAGCLSKPEAGACINPADAVAP